MRVLDYTRVADVKIEVAAVIESCGCLWEDEKGEEREKSLDAWEELVVCTDGWGWRRTGEWASLAGGKAPPAEPNSRRRAEQLQTRTQNFTSGDRETPAYYPLHLLYLSTHLPADQTNNPIYARPV